MIQVQHVAKAYMTLRGRQVVFRDLDFNVPAGLNVGLIGVSGSGKSTLIRLLAKAERPDKGRIVTPPRASWPLGATGGIQTALTARQSVHFVCRLYGLSFDETEEVVAFVREFANIGIYFDRPAASYLAGMRARVAFGLSLAFKFDYYLIDGAIEIGDAEFRGKTRAIFEQRLEESKVVLVSHKMSLIRQRCDVVVVLDEGKARLYEDKEEGIAAYESLMESM